MTSRNLGRCVAWLLWAGCWGQAPMALADGPRVMAWQDCVAEAWRGNPDLAAAAAKIKQSQSVEAITRSHALPQISGDAGYSVSRPNGTTRSKEYSFTLNGQQLLFDGFKTANDLRADKANARASNYNYAVVSSNVRLALRSAFVDVLNAQESLVVARGILAERKQEVDAVSLRYQGGSENKGALLIAQANWAEAQYDVAYARRDIVLSQRRLQKVMGWPAYVPIEVTGDLGVQLKHTVEPDYAGLIEGVPLLKQLVALKEAARYGVKSAQSDFFPQIYATGGAGRRDSQWPLRKSSWSAGVSVSVPLFEGGRQQAELSRSRAALEEARAEERGGRDSVLFTLADTWTQLVNAADNVDVQRQFLEAAKLRAKIAEVQYASGLVSFDNWIIIADALVTAQKKFLATQTNALIAEANWAQAKGETLDE